VGSFGAVDAAQGTPKALENEDAPKPPLFSSLKHYTRHWRKCGVAFLLLQANLSRRPLVSQLVGSCLKPPASTDWVPFHDSRTPFNFGDGHGTRLLSLSIVTVEEP
jgi:hypothetical protein